MTCLSVPTSWMREASIDRAMTIIHTYVHNNPLFWRQQKREYRLTQRNLSEGLPPLKEDQVNEEDKAYIVMVGI